MSQASGFPQASPGQFQPVYTQAPPGQPLSTPQAQPGQYFVRPGQQIQAVGQQAQPGQRPNRRRPTVPRTTAYWKSSFIADKLVEFLMLLATWICIVSYTKGMIGADARVSFFKGITVFCWVMVIVFQIAFAPLFSSLTQNFFSKPRHFTIICLVVQIILTILLIACTIFGVFSCFCSLDDIRSLYKMVGTQKAEEQQAVVVNQQQVVGAFAQSVPAESEPHDAQM
ncbi:uncharacterized protein [Montipora capricornis]|uniref:uncharacterized protein isoform X2 n=1 Tax=Montipora capricornis TaxID=246305 RepID=UPI0035F17F86